MLENIPTQSIMTELLGQSLYEIWQALCSAIDEIHEIVGYQKKTESEITIPIC